MRHLGFLIVVLSCLSAPVSWGQTREEKVRQDKARVEADGFWIYNDLERGFAEAKASGKPLVVVLRCIPCEECVKLDDDLVDKDERLRPLLEQFVRVRLVSTNGLDLSLFQFDTDQSFAVFLFNADRTIYGRFGTRSDQREWADDVSVEGLARALEGALALHRKYPDNKAELAAKRGPEPDFPVPEQFPMLRGKFGPQLDYDGNVVRSCIHCHQIGDAQRAYHRAHEATIPERVLFPYPHPKALGLVLDPKQRAAVLRVESGSPAADAGFQSGDVIERLSGQPLLSIADVQWVLHHTPAQGATLQAAVLRDGQRRVLAWKLPAGWRSRDDIGWRVSSWELRRMGLGGLLAKPLPAEERAAAKVPDEGMALRVEHVGQHPPHDVAKRAGFQKGDVLIRFDGRSDLSRETDLLAYAINQVKPGQRVPVTLLRDGKQIEITLPVPQ